MNVRGMKVMISGERERSKEYMHGGIIGSFWGFATYQTQEFIK